MSEHPGALGALSPDQLTNARLMLHWAAQVGPSVARSLLPHQADDSHTNLGWSRKAAALVTHQMGPSQLAVGLALRDFKLIILTPDQSIVQEFPLVGRSLDDAYDWTASVMDAELARPDYDLPPHPVQTGVPFEPVDPAVLNELSKWFSVADSVLSELVRKGGRASDVRCWPHHFDIATLVTLPTVGETQPTIGIGMSPGDTTYAEPYWYITPWPYPKAPPPLKLPEGGHWHDSGWIGAVLTATAIAAESDATMQRAGILRFIKAAVTALDSDQQTVK